MRGGLGGGDQIYCCRFVRKSPEEQPGRREEICYLLNLPSLHFLCSSVPGSGLVPAEVTGHSPAGGEGEVDQLEVGG